MLIADPFVATGDVVPTREFKVFKMINNVPEYRIGPGDVLDITFWEGLKEREHKVTVSPQGKISFSYIEDFKISGYTRTEAEKAFSKLLKKIVKKPRVKVEIPVRRAYSASIFGAVRSPRPDTGPGTYNLYGKERLTQFLSRVGGHLDNADLTRVQLTRNRRTYFLNIFDALFKADFRQDVIIDDGDVIFIPTKEEVKNRVYVLGEVNSPGLLTYDKSMTLLEAITTAGGPTFYSKTKDILVIRGGKDKPEAIKVNYDDIVRKGDFRQNIELRNGDIVYVAKTVIGNINDFLAALTPIIDVMSVPTDIYTAIEGAPPATILPRVTLPKKGGYVKIK
jgi:polysaccharide export outer membrane protein